MRFSSFYLLLLHLTFVQKVSSATNTVNAYLKGLKFVGNTTVADHFKLLHLDGNYLLIGARDVVYNISMNDFSVHQAISWPTDQNVTSCAMKGRSEEVCHNYVRVLAKDYDGGVLVCGTNAFQPECRKYKLDTDSGLYTKVKNYSGVAISPPDPHHNSTYLYAADVRVIYTGTVTDQRGQDPLIHRKSLDSGDWLRTPRWPQSALNNPNFVGSLEHDQSVYFWFRESSGNDQLSTCGTGSKPRVARVCKNDPGKEESWTTFLKAPLNCSIPGDYPFYFDDIEAVTNIVQSGEYGRYGKQLIYAAFNTPYAGIQGSAICAFDIEALVKTFEQSPFKDSLQQGPKNRNCKENPSSTSPANSNYNPLLLNSVANYFRTPVFLQTGSDDKFTQIAVDAQVVAADRKSRFDVIFIGTDRGTVLKVVNLVSDDGENTPVLVETVQVFADQMPVRNLLVYRKQSTSKLSSKGAHLVVVNDHEVRRLPLQYCAKQKSCVSCLALRDPYCAWNGNQCVSTWSNNENVEQNVLTGYSANCPVEKAKSEDVILVADSRLPVLAIDSPPTVTAKACNCAATTVSPITTTTEDRRENRVIVAPIADFPLNDDQFDSQQTGRSKQGGDPAVVQVAGVSGVALTVGIICSIGISLLIGFIAGYYCRSRDCLARGKTISRTPSTPRQQQNTAFTASKLNGVTPAKNGVNAFSTFNHINAYEATPKFNGALPAELDTSIPNLVVSLDDEIISSHDKNAIMLTNNNVNCSTLPRDYKVKKMYL